MKTLGVFLAGAAVGWILRSSFDSFRELAVGAVAAGYDMANRTRRAVAMEKEFLEDLVAEGRARFEAGRAARETQHPDIRPITPIGKAPLAA
jgi:hypothetical protein